MGTESVDDVKNVEFMCANGHHFLLKGVHTVGSVACECGDMTRESSDPRSGPEHEEGEDPNACNRSGSPSTIEQIREALEVGAFHHGEAGCQVCLGISQASCSFSEAPAALTKLTRQLALLDEHLLRLARENPRDENIASLVNGNRIDIWLGGSSD